MFGSVAGAAMVGVNVAAQRAGIAYQQFSGSQGPASSVEAGSPFQADSSGNSESLSQTIKQATPSEVNGSVSDVVKNTMPSVVAITNMIKYKQNGFSIFGEYQSYETEVPASGSGVIIGKNDTELLILTNNHVVSSSESLSITFIDNETIDADIKGTDASADLALLSIKLDLLLITNSRS